MELNTMDYTLDQNWFHIGRKESEENLVRGLGAEDILEERDSVVYLLSCWRARDINFSYIIWFEKKMEW